MIELLNYPECEALNGEERETETRDCAHWRGFLAGLYRWDPERRLSGPPD